MATIIYPPTINFSWLYQRPQQLLTCMAKKNYKVYYCNKSYDSNYKKGITQIKNNFYLVNGVDLSYIKSNETPILWISYPPNYRYIKSYVKKYIIFDSIDFPSNEFNEWISNFRELQREANIIFASSSKLYEINKNNNSHTFLLPNGADFDNFNKARKIFFKKPTDIPVGKPVIGYFGALATWLDWDLIDYISLKHPEYNFLFIGPNLNVSQLPERENIFYLGEKNYNILPYYLQYFDVCIIPFKITPMTEGCDPIKLYEYMSAGKAVVSTNLPEVKRYDEIYVANNKEEFANMLTYAINDVNDNKRKMLMKIAKSNSWEKRAEYADRIIRYYIL